ncbi:uncharacterized protein NESG_01328 [Nematocida ausubeli]|uniref:TLC domain-containing protein n=1 Tax=Nematocida ausubeli (strain ATCC PRA-371 / ERTm2) TaxID=1913371 RepID=A0A086J244_NEMA1|nr:uncharacterized protein NESG_01328 [Nematocida ausubeli]KAI5135480.1 very-long-chain ceramide synthase [Nematocida ausubeli]KFG26212.1 hypothetical protein NESG_01328 [Nematocida ausubeli]
MREEWATRSMDSALRFPEDLILYGAGIILYVILHYIIKRVVSPVLIRALSRVPEGQIDGRKFRRALWKAFCFGILSAWGLYTVSTESWIFSPFGITLQWPNNATPCKVNMYYILETVYYSGSFITMFFEEKQSDFYLMIYHHFVTLVLVGFSYRYNFLRYGVFIMLLHDISDSWMDSAKIAVYLGYQTLGNILFIIFSILFIVPRILIYVFMILIPGYSFLWEFGSKLLVPIWGLLLGVFLLNSYWSVLIVRMAIEFIKKGELTKDIRDLPPQKDAKKSARENAKSESKKKNE